MPSQFIVTGSTATITDTGPPLVPAGQHTYYVEQVNAAGNASQPSGGLLVTIQTACRRAGP